MEWQNESIRQLYKGCLILVSTVRPKDDDSFRVAYSVLGVDGGVIMWGSTVSSWQEMASLQAFEAAHEFVDSLPTWGLSDRLAPHN